MRTLNAAVLLGLAACGGARTATSPVADVTLVVVDAGAEPRQRVQYQWAVHVPERMETTLKLREDTTFTNAALETGHKDVDLPTVKLTARIEVTSVSPDGVAAVTAETTDVTVSNDVVDPAVRAPYEADMNVIKGLRTSSHVAPSGRLVGPVVESRASGDARPSTHAAAADVTRDALVVFPDVPIGVGATWTTTAEARAAGATWHKTMTYRLRALDGDTAVIEVLGDLHAAPQTLVVQPNAASKLTAGTGHVQGDVTIALHHLVGTSLSRATTETSLRIDQGQLRITTTMKAESQISTKPLSDSR